MGFEYTLAHIPDSPESGRYIINLCTTTGGYENADLLRVKCVGVLAAARARKVPPVGVRAVDAVDSPKGDLSSEDCDPSLS
jgi:hypothetical protein